MRILALLLLKTNLRSSPGYCAAMRMCFFLSARSSIPLVSITTPLGRMKSGR